MELNHIHAEPKESIDFMQNGNTNNASQNEFEELMVFNNFKASLPPELVSKYELEDSEKKNELKAKITNVKIEDPLKKEMP